MEKFLRKNLKYSLLIVIVILLITFVFAKIAKENSRLETNLDNYMPQEHPAFQYSNKAEKWFNIKDAVMIAVYNENGIFNNTTLRKIKSITKELGKMKEIRKEDITSLYTADNIVGTDDGLDVKKFYKRVPKSKEKIEEIKKKVISNDMVYGKIVSKNLKVAIIVARIDNNTFSQKFYKKILELGKKYEGQEKIYIAGRPIVEGTLAYLMPKDMKKMVPIVIIFILGVLWFLLKSFKNTITTLTVVLISTIWTFGLMAALRIPIYAVSTMIPVMLIAIGVAYGVHLYSHLELYIKENTDVSKPDAISNMVKEMWKPVMMAAITTMVGFISLLTSEVYPVKYFGLFSAFGVFSAFILSLVFIPSILHIFGLPKFKSKKDKKAHSKIYFSITEKIIRYRKTVIIVSIAIILLSIYGITKVWISSSFLAKFEKNSEIVKTDRFVNRNFGGTTTLNVILEGKNENTFKTPEVLSEMVKLQNKVTKSLKVVGDSFSLADFIKRMNKVMHSDKEEFNNIPDNRNLIAQYLLLYEMSGDPENLWRMVDDKYQKANLTFQLKSDDSVQLKKAINIIENFREKFKKMGIEVHYAGSGYKALVFTDLLLKGQISSLVLSLIIVVLLLTIMFKNFYIGLIGSIPIIATALINFGVMGFSNIPLSSTTALISSIAIGIGIDYAIHFIDRYKIYSTEFKDKDTVAKYTMYHSGRAILFNAMVVIAGFMVLVFSVFPPNRNLGELVSLNMFTSFLGTLTIMFIILYIKNIYFKKEEKMRNRNFFTILIVLSFLTVNLISGEKITGLDIMKKVYNRAAPKEMEAELTMTLVNSNGGKRVRKIKQFIKDFGKVEKKIMFFLSPADVRNTSFMNWSYDDPEKDDDQWIYLPALKKIKRISSDSKGDYFMGSDFTYDDLGDRNPEEDNHKILKTEKFNGLDCYVIESTPKDQDYMYSKTITWVVKDRWYGLKKVFYDEDGEHLKTLTLKKAENIKGYWIITNVEMTNIQKNHKTIMKLSNLKIDSGISSRMFTERMMKRGL